MSLEVRLDGYTLSKETFVLTSEHLEKILSGMLSPKGLSPFAQLMVAEQMAHHILNQNLTSTQLELFTYNMVQFFRSIHYKKMADAYMLLQALLKTSLSYTIKSMPEWSRIEREFKSSLSRSNLMNAIAEAADRSE